MSIGLETRVNSYTTSHQVTPQLTGLSDGGWVITWRSLAQDGDSYGIYAQAYNADGTVQGGETRVNTFTTGLQFDQQITALSDGGWVITWESNGQDGDDYGVYAQAYNADGTVQGGETQVNTETDSAQIKPQITALSDGGWVITWESYDQDGDSYGIYAQAYNADGTVQGGETQVNTYTVSFQNSPQITALNDGGWVITWMSYAQDTSGGGVYAQAYDSDGIKQGGETLINTFTTGDQFEQKITALSDGGWVITWQSWGQDGDGYGIYAQAYNANGTVQGAEIHVSTHTSDGQKDAQIAALSDGGWVITWESGGQDGSGDGIYAQAYNSDGTVRGGETQVNTYTTATQGEPQITALSDGGWVITWQSADQDGSLNGIYAQAYHADGTPRGDELQVNTYVTSTQETPQIAALSDGGWVITWVSLGQDGDGYGIYSRSFNPLKEGDFSVSLTGTQGVGEVLTAVVDGVDADNEAISVTYTWTVGSDIVATTLTPTFTLTQEHAGQKVEVSVVIRDLVFDSAVTEIATTARIDDGNNDPTGTIFLASDNAAGFEIYASGDTVIADGTGILDDDVLGSFSFQWLLSGVEIAGANSSTYTIVAADEGHKLTVVISYTDHAGFDEEITSSKAKINGYTGDDLTGTALDNVMSGTEQKDRLNGLDGDDTLFGSAGNDILIGGNGADVLIGGAQRDQLTGGKDNDILIGGTGRDTFIFGSNHGDNIITDFQDGADMIKIKSGAAAFGDLTVSQVGDDVLVSFASTTITIEDMLVVNVTDADFGF